METKNPKIHYRHKAATQPNIVVTIPNVIIPIRITRTSIGTFIPIATVFDTTNLSRFHSFDPPIQHILNLT